MSEFREIYKPYIDELNLYRSRLKSSELYERQINQLRYEKDNPTAIADSMGIQSSQKNYTYQDSMIDKITKLEQEYRKLIIEDEQYRLEIEKKLRKLKYPYADILRLYYIEGKSDRRVARELIFSERHIKRMRHVGIAHYSNYPLIKKNT